MKETFQEYGARMASLAAGQDPVSLLQRTAGRIGELVAGRTTESLRWTTSPSRWSIAQILAHLADAEVVAAYRFRMILAAPGTPLQAFDQNDWAREMDYGSRDAGASLALFTALRRALLALLATLDEEGLSRYGVHVERGNESVRYLMGLYAGHDVNHVGQIERLIAEHDAGLGAANAFVPAPVKAPVDAGAVAALDVRVGTIRAAEPIAGTDRLATLTVDIGTGTRAIVAGLRTERASLDALVGTQALFVINLAPKAIKGQRSEGMLFDLGFADGLRPAFAQPEWPMPNGVRAG